MKLISLSFAELTTGWTLHEVSFREGLNLFVGATGAGKSRIFNVVSNLAGFVRNTKAEVPPLEFCLRFAHKGVHYQWDYAPTSRGSKYIIDREVLTVVSDGQHHQIAERSGTQLHFKGERVPKLSNSLSLIALFKEEDSISPLYEAFGSIEMRSFYSAELANAMSVGRMPTDEEDSSEEKQNEELLPRGITSVNIRLAMVQKKNPAQLHLIYSQFKSIFPFVDDIRVREVTQLHKHRFGVPIPLVELRERTATTYVPITDISSGMQKVLLLLTDVITADDQKLYLIEEYENSLGINAIHFLPRFVAEFGGNKQILVTSHHPHLINSVPISNWFVVSRTGTNIAVTPGTELERKYGASHHAQFVQLINDPLYVEGIS